MGYLKIDKVIYYGEEYHYESPDFEDGINVIEGVMDPVKVLWLI